MARQRPLRIEFCTSLGLCFGVVAVVLFARLGLGLKMKSKHLAWLGLGNSAALHGLAESDVMGVHAKVAWT
jgi:hypothetical protein